MQAAKGSSEVPAPLYIQSVDPMVNEDAWSRRKEYGGYSQAFDSVLVIPAWGN